MGQTKRCTRTHADARPKFLYRGAGAFACPSRARPRPLARARRQTGTNRIVLHIADDAVQLLLIPHAMVVGLVLPEHLPRPAQYKVGLTGSGTFQPAGNYRQRCLGPQQHMHVIGHDHPSSEFVEVPSGLAIQKRVCHCTRYSRVLQPNRPGRSLVHFAVQIQEGSAGGRRRAGTRLRPSKRREGIGQPPGNKQVGCLGDIGMQVRQPSAVEHNGWAGGSACPTIWCQPRWKIAEICRDSRHRLHPATP